MHKIIIGIYIIHVQHFIHADKYLYMYDETWTTRLEFRDWNRSLFYRIIIYSWNLISGEILHWISNNRDWKIPQQYTQGNCFPWPCSGFNLIQKSYNLGQKCHDSPSPYKITLSYWHMKDTGFIRILFSSHFIFCQNKYLYFSFYFRIMCSIRCWKFSKHYKPHLFSFTH